jgi:outer membrane protein assembly factor BamB
MNVLLILTLATLLQETPTANWPSFRGADAGGVATAALPLTWNGDPAAGPARNIRWKTPIPGLSHSSPVVWGDRLFVATAVRVDGEAPLKVGLYGSGAAADDDTEQRWAVFALDRGSGKILWEQTARRGIPRSRRHPKATHANTTLATDGKRVIAFFGSEGLYVYDFQGELLWKKDLGILDSGPVRTDLQWGHAGSPVISGGALLLQCDQKKGSFLAALSVEDGKELWRTDREGVCSQSWATPTVVSTAGRTQVVCNGWPFIASYDLATGKELWRLRSGGDIPVPAPVFAHGLIFVTNSHGGQAPLYAIRPEASGDLTLRDGQTTNDGIAWSEPRNGAYLQTPLVAAELVYSCSDRGVLKVYAAKTGELKYTQRLGSGKTGFTSSPVAAGGRIYLAGEEGEVQVLKAGPVYELLATNPLGELILASPAIARDTLYFRTRRHVVAIGE